MRSGLRSATLSLIFLLLFMLLSSESCALSEDILLIVEGTSKVIPVEELIRVAVADPTIADIVVSSKNELIVNGISPGYTSLHIWQKSGLRSIRVRILSKSVNIAEELQALLRYEGITVTAGVRGMVIEGYVENYEELTRIEKISRAYSDNVINLVVVRGGDISADVGSQAGKDGSKGGSGEVIDPDDIGALIGESGITVRSINGRLLLSGSVRDQNSMSRLKMVAAAIDPGFINLVEIESKVQVLLKILIVEINKNRIKDLGVEWGSNIGGIFKPGELIFEENLFGSFGLTRARSLRSILNLLERNDAARVLATPSLVAESGQDADFLVGGEIPIFLGESDGKVEFEWKPYGISLKMRADVREIGGIDLSIQPEVSSLDWENGLKIQGYEIPALKTRRIQTSVSVGSGNTLVIGGLIQKNESVEIRKTPLLGDIPIIGNLFRSRRFIEGESELLIFVTPDIISGDEGIEPDILVEGELPEDIESILSR
jgi:Flp pilus assembly secretin CpaC